MDKPRGLMESASIAKQDDSSGEFGVSESVEDLEAGEGGEIPLFAYPGHLIRRMQQIAVAIFHEEMAAIGVDLTPVQYSALTGIRNYPGIDQASLAGVIGYDRTTIGGVIDRLESKGLVKRTVSSADRRVRQLAIEAEGDALIAQIEPSVQRAQARIVEPLNGEEREAFMVLLRKLLAANNHTSRAPLRPFPRGSSGAP